MNQLLMGGLHFWLGCIKSTWTFGWCFLPFAGQAKSYPVLGPGPFPYSKPFGCRFWDWLLSFQSRLAGRAGSFGLKAWAFIALLPGSLLAQWDPARMPLADTAHWKTQDSVWIWSADGHRSHSLNSAKHQWSTLHSEPHEHREDLAWEWRWKAGFSSTNYLEIAWLNREETIKLKLGDVCRCLQVHSGDTLLAQGPYSLSSSSLSFVLLIHRNFNRYEAELWVQGQRLDALTWSGISKRSDSIELRIGQSGKSAIGSHEWQGFYRGEPLDWGWAEAGDPAMMALTEIALSAPSFGGASFIELVNTGGKAANTMGWTLSDPHYSREAPRSRILAPGERICLSQGRPHDARISFQQWDKMPHLNQDGDTLWLRDAQGQLLAQSCYRVAHWGAYSSSWGYTLEKACESFSCLEEFNWQPSELPGGSPGLARSEPCPIDSTWIYARTPILVQSGPWLDCKDPPHSWGNWTLVDSSNKLLSWPYFMNPDSTLSVHISWCNHRSSLDHLPHTWPLAQRSTLRLSECMLGAQGAGQSFLELYNPGDSAVNLQHHRLEFYRMDGEPLLILSLASLFSTLGPKAIAVLAENPQQLAWDLQTRIGTWTQEWNSWPSGHQDLRVYACSAQQRLDSMIWPSLRYPLCSQERAFPNGHWQRCWSEQGQSPGMLRNPSPEPSPTWILTQRELSTDRPSAYLHLTLAEPATLSAYLFNTQGTYLKTLFSEDCSSGTQGFALYREQFPGLSPYLLLLESSNSTQQQRECLRISRID